jgi:hypothetical protein
MEKWKKRHLWLVANSSSGWQPANASSCCPHPLLGWVVLQQKGKKRTQKKEKKKRKIREKEKKRKKHTPLVGNDLLLLVACKHLLLLHSPHTLGWVVVVLEQTPLTLRSSSIHPHTHTYL